MLLGSYPTSPSDSITLPHTKYPGTNQSTASRPVTARSLMPLGSRPVSGSRRMCCIQHARSAKYARAIAGVPHILWRKKWRPQSWPSHNSKPELMKPGTMTTGWCGFLPAARACAPGEGDPRLPLPLNAVVLSAGKPLSRCMEELSQCGMACSTRSWKASGMAPIGMARRYTARHATQTNAARRFTRSTRAFADWRFVRETTRVPSFAGFFGAASRFFPFEAPGAEAPDAAFFAFPRDEGSSAGSLSSTFRPRRRTAPVAGFAIGALFDRTEGALAERARDCVVGRSETRGSGALLPRVFE